ncbi:sestrin-1-like isoform X2 [Octopus vulgaris]|uniref:Sestrin-1-like isoform X2 n=2 Tax=Octopus TaxID=6643 RepID=A0AA36FH32_OCTVU|nr:sestrin-3 isoform X1 [Octopus sinensis]CAI9734168.1 sestrin-1-like isoform X2 [Octopus vulgaris]
MGLSFKSPEHKRVTSRVTAMIDVVPVDTTNEETRTLFVNAFITNNRSDYITHLMAYHTKYLECFLKTQNHLMRADGPLPFAYRHYIAIMAAGRHKCSYLIQLQATEFLLQSGNADWLKGLDYIPQKLRDLYEINKLLAHRPWLINKSHIEKLTKGPNNWSVSEVTQALIILSHFHALSGFIYGCGISCDFDADQGLTYLPASKNYDDSCENGCQSEEETEEEEDNSYECFEGGVEALLERMKKLSETQEEATEEEMLKGFEKVESPNLELSTSTENLTANKSNILRYVYEPDYTYQDFKRVNYQEVATFRAQDYSWEDHGFSLANRLYPEIGSLLDEKFRVAYNLTYNTMGNNKGVDTTAFRRAIWNYIHFMYGIRHDDYNYNEVTDLLERDLKTYVKTVTCYPEQVSYQDYKNVLKGFQHSEKVHVNLMMLEARLQAELLYSLRAVMRYMT